MQLLLEIQHERLTAYFTHDILLLAPSAACGDYFGSRTGFLSPSAPQAVFFMLFGNFLTGIKSARIILRLDDVDSE